MARIRVVRILEYTYDDSETMGATEQMAKDMTHWQLGANNVYSPHRYLTIRSATLPLDVLAKGDYAVPPEPQVKPTDG